MRRMWYSMKFCVGVRLRFVARVIRGAESMSEAVVLKTAW